MLSFSIYPLTAVRWFYLFYIQMPIRLGLPAHPPLYVMSFLLDPGGGEDLVSTPTHTGAFLHPLFWQIKNSSNPKKGHTQGSEAESSLGSPPRPVIPTVSVASAWLRPDMPRIFSHRKLRIQVAPTTCRRRQYPSFNEPAIFQSKSHWFLSEQKLHANGRGFPVKIQLLFKENAEPRDIPLVIY